MAARVLLQTPREPHYPSRWRDGIRGWTYNKRCQGDQPDRAGGGLDHGARHGSGCILKAELTRFAEGLETMSRINSKVRLSLKLSLQRPPIPTGSGPSRLRASASRDQRPHGVGERGWRSDGLVTASTQITTLCHSIRGLSLLPGSSTRPGPAHDSARSPTGGGPRGLRAHLSFRVQNPWETCSGRAGPGGRGQCACARPPFCARALSSLPAGRAAGGGASGSLGSCL